LANIANTNNLDLLIGNNILNGLTALYDNVLPEGRKSRNVINTKNEKAYDILFNGIRDAADNDQLNY